MDVEYFYFTITETSFVSYTYIKVVLRSAQEFSLEHVLSQWSIVRLSLS